jgi:hypothetical protein
MEIEDRADVLSDGDVAGVVLFGAKLAQMVRDFESTLPKHRLRQQVELPPRARKGRRGKLAARSNGQAQEQKR